MLRGKGNKWMTKGDLMKAIENYPDDIEININTNAEKEYAWWGKVRSKPQWFIVTKIREDVLQIDMGEYK